MSTFRDDIIAFIKATATRRPLDNRNACGKYQHLNADDAMKAVTDLSRTENTKLAHRLNAYQCSACGYFHIGHNPFHGRAKRYLNAPRIANIHQRIR